MLDQSDMMKILTEPKNALLKQYQKLFMLEGIHLDFHENALKEVVKIALEQKAGARALRSVMEEHLLDIMYNLPDLVDVEKIIITKDVITNSEPPIYQKINRRKKSA